MQKVPDSRLWKGIRGQDVVFERGDVVRELEEALAGLLERFQVFLS